jgi:hypothetical protein
MNILRITAAVAALALTATPALAVNPDKDATATARIIKPLTLTWVQDLDLGSITLVDSGPTTVGIDQAGTFSCPGTAVTCSGATKVAKYKITGTNNQVVTVNAGNVSMVGPAGSTPLLLTVDAPASVNLLNSGSSGTEFSIGGSISVAGTQAEGTYIGTFAVTVNY